jgi:hypothetical protein
MDKGEDWVFAGSTNGSCCITSYMASVSLGGDNDVRSACKKYAFSSPLNAFHKI